MNPAVVRQTSHREAKSRPFGFGYEAKSADRPSVQSARAEFLDAILKIQPQAVFSLLITCYLPFTQLMERCEPAISAIVEAVEESLPKENYILRQPKFMRERALKRLIPNFRSLATVEGAAELHKAVASWGLAHNLTDDWCLDDALEALRAFEVADEKRMALTLLPDSHFLIDVWKRSWQSAILERRFFGLHRRFQASAAVEKRNALLFRFKYETLEFELSGPFNKSLASFRREVKDQFEAMGGRKVRGARKQLNYAVREYLSLVDRVRTDLDLAAPPNWRKADDFFNWLVNYQIAPGRTYRQIARDVERDEKTVREGIQRLASLIGLTLRSNESDKRLGRPKGARDKALRRRVDRGREKVRGNPN